MRRKFPVIAIVFFEIAFGFSLGVLLNRSVVVAWYSLETTSDAIDVTDEYEIDPPGSYLGIREVGSGVIEDGYFVNEVFIEPSWDASSYFRYTTVETPGMSQRVDVGLCAPGDSYTGSGDESRLTFSLIPSESSPSVKHSEYSIRPDDLSKSKITYIDLDYDGTLDKVVVEDRAESSLSTMEFEFGRRY